MSNKNCSMRRTVKNIIKITAVLSTLVFVMAACSAAAGTSGGSSGNPTLPTITLSAAPTTVSLGGDSNSNHRYFWW